MEAGGKRRGQRSSQRIAPRVVRQRDRYLSAVVLVDDARSILVRYRDAESNASSSRPGRCDDEVGR